MVGFDYLFRIFTMHMALHPRDDFEEYMYQEKSGEEDLPALKTTLTHRYDDALTTQINTKED